MRCTPPKTNECPLKRDELSIGNTSEQTIDFQGTFVRFPGSTLKVGCFKCGGSLFFKDFHRVKRWPSKLGWMFVFMAI